MVEVLLIDRADEICLDGDFAQFESVDGIGIILRVYETGEDVTPKVTSEFKADKIEGWWVEK